MEPSSTDLKNINKRITPRSEDYSQWYLDIVAAADLAENAAIRGCMIIKPYGYALWETVQKFLDGKIKETGVENAYFPLFIPEKFLKKEASHVEGFSPEVAMVTHAGGKKLEEPFAIRPTSETIMYDAFSNWIQSYRDLPLLINQWANVVRWEKRPRLFLRTTEFLWQEGHTVHETEEGADERARQMLNVYVEVAEKLMAIPVIPGRKTESEKFAGALYTYAVEAMMQDGKALQFATSHNLGQNFAKAFDVTFLGRDGEKQYGWQTSWGLSTRVIGGLIMTHSDDKGLVLPPAMAPIQAVITTISKPEEREVVDAKAEDIASTLKAAGIRTRLDTRDIRPGEKFYEWERKGVPVRIELGPKDIQSGSAIVVRRDTGEKQTVAIDALAETVVALCTTIQQDLFNNALAYQKEKTVEVSDWDTFKAEIEKGNFVIASFLEDKEIEAKIKEETAATVRCIPFDLEQTKGVCVFSGKPASARGIFAKSY